MISLSLTLNFCHFSQCSESTFHATRRAACIRRCRWRASYCAACLRRDIRCAFMLFEYPLQEAAKFERLAVVANPALQSALGVRYVVCCFPQWIVVYPKIALELLLGLGNA